MISDDTLNDHCTASSSCIWKFFQFGSASVEILPLVHPFRQLLLINNIVPSRVKHILEN